jgi:biopolymer transport protein ExbB
MGPEWYYTTETGWWDTDWSYRKQITIDHDLVDADLQNFPILFHNTSTDFSTNAQIDGDDFVFISSTGTPFNHEIEYYDSSSGELIAWVNITDLSSVVDTVFYLYYGNPSSGTMEDIEGTWDSDYMFVYHMTDNTTGSISDSTRHHDDGVKYSTNQPLEAEGIVYRCQDFDGINDWIDTTNSGFDIDNNDWTVEVWAYVDDHTSGQGVFQQKNGDGTGRTILDLIGSEWATYLGGSAHYSGHNTQSLWEYISLTYDVSVDDAEWFFNGLPGLLHQDIGVEDADGGFVLGSWKTHGGGFYDGLEDEVRFSSIKRSDAWIGTTYNTIVDRYLFILVGPEES